MICECNFNLHATTTRSHTQQKTIINLHCVENINSHKKSKYFYHICVNPSVGCPCNTHGRKERRCEMFRYKNLKERDNFGD
jgi:hypothetical protein